MKESAKGRFFENYFLQVYCATVPTLTFSSSSPVSSRATLHCSFQSGSSVALLVAEVKRRRPPCSSTTYGSLHPGKGEMVIVGVMVGMVIAVTVTVIRSLT